MYNTLNCHFKSRQIHILFFVLSIFFQVPPSPYRRTCLRPTFPWCSPRGSSPPPPSSVTPPPPSSPLPPRCAQLQVPPLEAPPPPSSSRILSRRPWLTIWWPPCWQVRQVDIFPPKILNIFIDQNVVNVHNIKIYFNCVPIVPGSSGDSTGATIHLADGKLLTIMS